MDSATLPKRRRLLRVLAETPVIERRSARVPADSSARITLGVIVGREPGYAPPTSLLGRMGAAEKSGCEPPRRSVLVAVRVEHPPHDRIEPLLGPFVRHPPRAFANLLHQVLKGLWSLDAVPSAEAPDAGQMEGCGSAERRPPRSSALLASQVQPPEEIVEVAEPPQAEAREPQT